MNNIIDVDSFKFNNYNLIAFLDENEEVWFVANQVLEILDYNMSQVSRTLKRNVQARNVKKLKRSELVSLISNGTSRPKGRVQELDETLGKVWTSGVKDTKEKAFINEPGLYALIMHSHKKEAEDFQDWVYEDVIRTIRKTGKYEMNQNNLPANTTDSKELTVNKDNIEEIFTMMNNNLVAIAQTLQDKANKQIEQNEQQLKLSEKTDNTNNLILNAILNASNGFYQNKDYGANYSDIKLYRTDALANEFRMDLKSLNDYLLKNGYIGYNNGQFAPVKDLVYYPTPITIFARGLAVIMPYDDQERYPGCYFYRWTDHGRKVLYNELKKSGHIVDNNEFNFPVNHE